MAFNLSLLKTQPAITAAPAPEAPATLINRPASQRPAVAPAEALTVTTIEGSAAAHALVEFVDTEGEPATIVIDGRVENARVAEEAPPAPKARRGRPRKTPPADGVASAPPAEGVGVVSDPKAPAPTTTAPGCAPSAGDRCADARVDQAFAALLDAVAELQAVLRGGGAS